VQWTRLDGAFRRIPFGVRKVGRIAASGEAIEVPDLADPLPDWVARPDWVWAGAPREWISLPVWSGTPRFSPVFRPFFVTGGWLSMGASVRV
jgi:hypothetical protein